MTGRSLLFGGIIAAAALAAFHNSFSVPFVFDDALSIPDNPTIRSLWPIAGVFDPPAGAGATVEGRPILNLSFALDYAVHGLHLHGYHAVNLGIHIAAGLLLFGICRRTMASREFQRFRSESTHADGFALAIALLWVVHPLQTESVTYLVQRAESLMGFFYLLTLYAFIRGTENQTEPRSEDHTWLGLSWVACLLGMGTKEVMVSAPLVILLYDRTFVAGSWSAAFQVRKSYYLALALTWAWLGWLVASAGNRGGTIGTSAGVTPGDYALCQAGAIVHYLRLSLWPHPLILDYGKDFVGPAAAAPWIAIDLALLAATAWALRRRPALGFLGAAFFLLLAPTSSVVGGTRQMLAEHRMYLPLAAVIALVVAALYSRLGRRAWWLVAPGVLVLATMTAARNTDYRSNLAIYSDTVDKRPGNAWARYNLASVLAEMGHTPEAVPQFEAALRIDPRYYQAHYNLANALASQGRIDGAASHYRAALLLNPAYAKAHYNYGNLLVHAGRTTEAAEQYEEAVRIQPAYIEAQDNLGSVLFGMGRLNEAAAHYRTALQFDPNITEAHYNLGNVLIRLGRTDEGIAELRTALRVDPHFAAARERLAELGADTGTGRP